MIISQDHLFFDTDYSEIYKQGLIEAETNPLVTKNKSNFIHWKNENQEIHREHYPAIMVNKDLWHYYKNNKIHRDDGPASLIKLLKTCIFAHDGKTHRIGGFASLNLTEEKYALYIEDQIYLDPKDYVQACKKWMNQNMSAHDSLETIDDLYQKLSCGYFDENLWKNGHFIG